MKISKKLGAILLALCMLLSMSLNALGVSAAQPTKGSITIHKYEGNTTDLKHDGTPIDSGLLELGGLKALKGIEFKITKMLLVDDEATTDYQDEHGNYYKKDGSFTATSDFTDVNGVVLFDELPLGVYYVEEIDGNIAEGGTTFGIEAFFVSVPTTYDDNGTQKHQYDVHVYPKNEQIAIEKELVEASKDGTVTWKISSNIPNDIANGKSFIITDELDSRLEYVNNTVVIKDGIGDDANDIKDYFAVSVATGNILTLDLKDGYFDDLAGIDNIYITFDTILIIDQTNTNDLGLIKNTADVFYKNASGNNFDRESDPAEVPVYGVNILKYGNGKPSNTLEGATFYIFASEKDAKEAIETYYTGKALKNPDTEEYWEVTTDEEGNANIYGLVEGTYYLVETKAPEKYNLLLTPIKVVFNEETVEYQVQVNVNNESGFTLPQTGGAGTLWFTFIGLSLIGTAMVIYTVSKKKKA